MVFAPNIDVLRTPLAGRAFETIGEDPFLVGELGVEYLKGLQDEGVIATAKHYVGNTQEGFAGEFADQALPGASLTNIVLNITEGNRLVVDAKIGERAMREIYALPFEMAIRQADPGAVMCAYNLVNTHNACESKGLLNSRLRKQAGFDGMVVADYFALHDPAKAIESGLTFEPWPGYLYGPNSVGDLLAEGKTTQAKIDRRVAEYLKTLFRFGVFDRPGYPLAGESIDFEAHDRLAGAVSAQSITLLKNDGILPLKEAETGTVALIGAGVDQVIKGGGSSNVYQSRFTSPLTSFVSRLGEERVIQTDGSDQEAAVAAAEASDVAIVIAADFMTEAVDRRCVSLQCPPAYGDQDSLIEAVAAANPKTVVVLETGAPVTTPWRDSVGALLQAWYPGQAPGPAIDSVIFGDRDPGGRLPSTFPARESQIPLYGDNSLYPGIGNIHSFAEGVNVGYRSYRQRGERPAFAFGHGLSYTRFATSNLRVLPPRKMEAARVQATIRNVGERTGYAVPQLYLRLGERQPGGLAPIRLADFRKLSLRPGESRKVTFPLSRRNLSVYRSSR